ncbi:MAG: primosomal protein N' [Helicobacter trogontum]|uniref:replication restart helicase PriA n=1 Tax=Helicobacter trogontum TaxID=50960 RepID=UPI00242B8711|nr:primosomal protein N' [Helicobacter trogontum]MCI5786342.1 primosomal protein N' [Helicobacter trogontum]
MRFILVAIIGRNLAPLTYYTHDEVVLYDIMKVSVRNRLELGIIVQILPNQDFTFEPLEAKKSHFSYTQIQRILLRFMSTYYVQGVGVTAQVFTAWDAKLDSKETQQSVLKNDVAYNLKKLSEDQENVLKECKQQDLSLIFGTTGSGKTEIYFHAIAECLNQGKQALLLMPEISLTPQMQARLNTAFPNLADTWHSKRTIAQKQNILQSLQDGKLSIIAGARSALFLPFENLGLIIVDEEHDDSYKSQNQPKYNARDLAIFLSTKDIRVILGSATPSPKSYYLAKKHNYLLHLHNKFHNSTHTLHYDETDQISISPHILHAITSTLEKKEQIIIFLPTRANFKILLCRHCKHKLSCPNCSITLSLHAKKNALVCHYCGFTSQIPQVCNICGSDMLSGMRMGTEEFKKELEFTLLTLNLTPNIAIFDRDNITTHKQLTSLLHDFEKQKIDILIGTHMIAKGHDYPNVTLSIIVGMDYMLHIPDYRAYETSLSLLYQVAGRSGRKQHGSIIVQTKDSKVINSLWGDYTKVLHYILNERNPLYPPFCRLALLRFGHDDEQKAHHLAKKFAEILYSIQDENTYKFEVVGISEASIFKVKKKYYYQVLLRSYSNFMLQKAIQHALSYATKDMQQCIDIDIDPLSF